MENLSNYQVKNSILLLVYNRIDTLIRVIDKLKEVKPSKIYVAADGPRNKPGDLEKCTIVRQTIKDRIDWPCEIKTLFRDQNLGCRNAITGGITWFFSQEEKGIILEDDTLPSISFFKFCDELLDLYEHDPEILHISGFNAFKQKPELESDYTFIPIPNIWGWASWKRVWNKIQEELGPLEDNALLHRLKPKISYTEYLYWKNLISKKTDTWDYHYSIYLSIQKGFCVLPQKNLVRNIGFGEVSTHTKNQNDFFSTVGQHELDFPLTHPLRKSTDPVYMKQIKQILLRLYVMDRLNTTIKRVKQLLR